MASEENRAQAIFEESVDLSTGDRTAYIDEACGEDETLKQAVLTLLTLLTLMILPKLLTLKKMSRKL